MCDGVCVGWVSVCDGVCGVGEQEQDTVLYWPTD